MSELSTTEDIIGYLDEEEQITADLNERKQMTGKLAIPFECEIDDGEPDILILVTN